MPRKILIAIELDEPSAHAVLGKAQPLCEGGDSCTVAHIIDPTSIAYSIDPTFTGALHEGLEASAIANAEARISTLAEPYNLPDCAPHVQIGQVAGAMGDLLATGGYQCLMIGSHGWHGWRRLLGTHAAAIVSRSPVDTWVFRIPHS